MLCVFIHKLKICLKKKKSCFFPAPQHHSKPADVPQLCVRTCGGSIGSSRTFPFLSSGLDFTSLMGLKMMIPGADQRYSNTLAVSVVEGQTDRDDRISKMLNTSSDLATVIACGHKRPSSCGRWDVIRLCAWSRAAGTRRAGAAAGSGSLMCQTPLHTCSGDGDGESCGPKVPPTPHSSSPGAPEIEPRNDSEAPDTGTRSRVAQRRSAAEPTGPGAEQVLVGNCQQVLAPLVSLHNSTMLNEEKDLTVNANRQTSCDKKTWNMLKRENVKQ